MIDQLITSILVASVIANYEPPKEEPPKQAATSTQEQSFANPTVSDFTNRLNQKRAEKGLKPLTESSDLNQSAQNWANQTTASRPHSNFGWEVQAWSCGLFTDVLTAWLNSPSHNRIILGDFTYIGYGHSNRGGCDYYVAQLKK